MTTWRILLARIRTIPFHSNKTHNNKLTFQFPDTNQNIIAPRSILHSAAAIIWCDAIALVPCQSQSFAHLHGRKASRRVFGIVQHKSQFLLLAYFITFINAICASTGWNGVAHDDCVCERRSWVFCRKPHSSRDEHIWTTPKWNCYIFYFNFNVWNHYKICMVIRMEWIRYIPFFPPLQRFES